MIATTASRLLDEQLTDPKFVDDPYPAYRCLWTEDPVHWCRPWQQWVVTRYDDVQSITRDPSRFSSEGWEATYLQQLPPEVRSLLHHLERHYSAKVLSNTDPPAHNRLRRSVVRSLAPRVLEAVGPDVERLVADLLERIDRPGVIDFISEFAYPLPAMVIAQLLGAPEEGREQFQRWSADLVAFVGSGSPIAERAVRANESLHQFRDYLEPIIEDARARPSNNLISLLVAVSDGDALTQDELISSCVTLLFAGHETTANLLGNGLLALLRNPEQLQPLRKQPTLPPTAVEELLRYDSPVQRLRRRAKEDVELRGKHIRAGDLVMAFNGAANRDPERFPDPDRLDLSRADSGHLSFGHGIHFCVGAALTRLEAPIAFGGFLERFPRCRLASGAQIEWKPNITFRGLKSLPLELN